MDFSIRRETLSYSRSLNGGKYGHVRKNNEHEDDLAGGAVTPTPCATSASISVDLDMVIEDNLNRSSGIIDDPAQGINSLPSRPTDCRDAQEL